MWDYKNNQVADDGYIYATIDGVRYAISDNSAVVTRQYYDLSTANISASINYNDTQYSVTGISDYAFVLCYDLTSVVIPDSVVEIGEGAFYACTSIEEIILPDSVNKIDDTAFRGCTSLKKVVIPDSVHDFGWGLFNGCEDVTIICSDNSDAARYCDTREIPHHA